MAPAPYKFLLFFFLLLGFSAASGQQAAREVIFETPPFYLGPYKYSTIKIAQDSRGAMWLGTTSGMVRFDGRNLQPFEGDGPEGLVKGQIRKIVTDVDRRLWVLIDGRLQVFDAASERWVLPKEIPENIFIDDVTSTEGQIWAVAGSEIYLYRPALADFRQIPVAHKLTSDVAFSRLLLVGDRKLIGVARNELYRIDVDESGSAEAIRIDGALGLVGAQLGTMHWDPFRKQVIITSNDGRLLVLRGNYEEAELAVPPDQSSPLADVRDVFVEADRIWFTTTLGIFYVTSDWSLVRASTEVAGSSALVAETVFRSSEGLYWLAVIDRGLFIGRSYEAEIFSAANSGLPVNNISSITTDDRNYFIGTMEGMFALDRKTLEVNRQVTAATYPQLLDEIIVSQLLTPDVHYLGTMMGGAYRYNRESGQLDPVPVDPSATNSLNAPGVTRILRLSSGEIVFMTFGGGVTLERQGVLINPVYEVPSEYFDVLDGLELPDGSVLLSTLGGFSILDVQSLTVRALPTLQKTPSGSLQSVPLPFYAQHFLRLGDGRIIIGTRSLGLIEVLIEDEQALVVTRSQNNNPVHSLAELPDGRIWAATGEGLQEVDPASLNLNPLPKHYGLSAVDPTSETFTVDVDGRILFGTDLGVFRVREDLTVEPAPPISVALSRVLIDGNPQPLGNIAEGLKLPAKTEVIQVSFFGAEYLFPSEIDYAYRLKGIVDDWQELGNDATVTLTSIPSGEYQLEVAARGLSGLWNREALSIPFIIDLPFWRHPLALGLYFFFLMVVLLVVDRYRKTVRQARKTKLQSLTQALHSQTRESELQRIKTLNYADAFERARGMLDSEILPSLAEVRASTRAASQVEDVERKSVLSAEAHSLAIRAETSGRSLLRLMLDPGSDLTFKHTKNGLEIGKPEPPSAQSETKPVITGFTAFLESEIESAIALYYSPKKVDLVPVIDLTVGREYVLDPSYISSLLDKLLFVASLQSEAKSQVIFRVQQSENLLVFALEQLVGNEVGRTKTLTSLDELKEYVLAMGGQLLMTEAAEGPGSFLEVTVPAVPSVLEDHESTGIVYSAVSNPYVAESLANTFVRCGLRCAPLPTSPSFEVEAFQWVVVDTLALSDDRGGFLIEEFSEHKQVLVIGADQADFTLPEEWRCLREIPNVEALSSALRCQD